MIGRFCRTAWNASRWRISGVEAIPRHRCRTGCACSVTAPTNGHVGREALTNRPTWRARTVTASTPKRIPFGRCPARTAPVGTATATWRRMHSNGPRTRSETANSFAATATIPTGPTTTSSTSGPPPAKPASHATPNSGGRSCGNTHRWWRTACSATRRMDRTSPRCLCADRHNSARRVTRHRATAVSLSPRTSCRRVRRPSFCSPRRVSTATARFTVRTIHRGICFDDEAAQCAFRVRRGGACPRPRSGPAPPRGLDDHGRPQGSSGRPQRARQGARSPLAWNKFPPL